MKTTKEMVQKHDIKIQYNIIRKLSYTIEIEDRDGIILKSEKNKKRIQTIF